MPQTTTAQNACSARIYIDDDSGTLLDVSGSSTTASLNLTKDIGAAFTFEGDFAVKTECKKDGTIDFSSLWTTATGEARALLEQWFQAGGRRTFRMDMPNSEVGSRRYEGEVRLEEYSFPVEAGNADPVVVTGRMVTDGELSFSTIAS
jgi:hypothetical protein